MRKRVNIVFVISCIVILWLIYSNQVFKDSVLSQVDIHRINYYYSFVYFYSVERYFFFFHRRCRRLLSLIQSVDL